jgi:hypothetical protein
MTHKHLFGIEFKYLTNFLVRRNLTEEILLLFILTVTFSVFRQTKLFMIISII